MPDCCAALADIARHCGENAKGLKRRVYVACVDHITSIPAPTSGVLVDTDIVMADNGGTPYTFTTFNIGKTNQAFEAEPAGDADGTTLEYRPTFFIPKMDAAKSGILNGTMNGEYILIMEDKNGERYILGDLEDGAVIKVKPQTDPNGYLISVEWDSAHLAYHYTGVIPV